MFFDPIYLVILGFGVVISLIASGMVKAAFHRGKQVPLQQRVTGAEIARAILSDAGIDDVNVVETHGFLSDHYNPISKTLALSPEVYHGHSAASAGVAAHEVGHAIQHAQGYTLMWVRSVLVPFQMFGSNLGPLLVIIGIALGSAQGVGMGQNIAIAGVVLFGLATLFTLVTVPVEFDASARAKDRLITLGIISRGEEDDAVRKVLFAAGLTYVAAAITALLQLLYWAWRAGLIGGSRSR
jgi:Zn-dependent membrane protease YugP